jgi:toxin ParE1/3/4
MGEYKLSRQAERTVLRIHAESEDLFGRYQADAYLAGLDRTFGLLADFP